MILPRNFYDELKEEIFKPITYGIFNKMDDDGYINYLEKLHKEPFSIGDFKYYDFELTDKEKFLIKMHNREFLKNVKLLKQKLSEYKDIILYIDYEIGLIRVVKLNKLML